VAIEAKGIGKRFGDKQLFSGVDFLLSQADNAFQACYYGPYNWEREAHKLPALYRQLLQS
jgi:hypothetical protein